MAGAPDAWLAEAQLELRRREAQRRGVARLEGVVVLPPRSPKPEPPPGFWEAGEGPAARVPSARELAETRLLALLRAKRAGRTPNLSTEQTVVESTT